MNKRYPRVHVRFVRLPVGRMTYTARVVERPEQDPPPRHGRGWFGLPYLTGACAEPGEVNYQRIYRQLERKYPDLVKSDTYPFRDRRTGVRYSCNQARMVTQLLEYVPRVSENQFK